MQPEPIIYVIDDDDAVRQSLEFLLKTAGITRPRLRLGQGISGRAAGRSNPGCIITDVRMPEITGIDLLRQRQGESASTCR